MRYVYIPPGEFRRSGENGTAYDVRISKGFWIGQTEVTQVAYERVIQKGNPSNFKGADRPVEAVSWHDAAAYCRAVGLRLPTEAEWEYAARAGTTEEIYGDLDKAAVYGGNSAGTTASVGTKLPNAWGLYDMLGNVWEWTNDWYGHEYYSVSPKVDPLGPEKSAKSEKVVRGGSWLGSPESVRVSLRLRSEAAVRLVLIGFRCAGELR